MVNVIRKPTKLTLSYNVKPENKVLRSELFYVKNGRSQGKKLYLNNPGKAGGKPEDVSHPSVITRNFYIVILFGSYSMRLLQNH